MAIKRKNIEETEENKVKPWKNIAYCDNFTDADDKRVKYLSENENIQVKVKRCGSGGERFVVKLRKNPDVEEKKEKKRRKGKKARKSERGLT